MKEEDPIKLDELAARLAYLIAGFIKDALTAQENKELDDRVCATIDNQRLFEELTDPVFLCSLQLFH